MKSLKQILRESYVPADVMGDGIDPKQLVQDLRELRHDLNRRTWLLTIMIFVLYLLAIGITLLNLNKPENIKSIFSAIGVTAPIPWIIAQMSKLWKEFAQTNLVIILCTHSNPTDVENLIKTLVESGFTQLKKPKP